MLWRTLSVSVLSCLWARKSLEKYQKERYVYLRVLPGIFVWIYDGFHDNFEIEIGVTKYLKEGCG